MAKIPTAIEAKLDANMKLMDELELSVTPTIFHLDHEGGLQQQRGKNKKCSCPKQEHFSPQNSLSTIP
jgi:hypothetical protein